MRRYCYWTNIVIFYVWWMEDSFRQIKFATRKKYASTPTGIPPPKQKNPSMYFEKVIPLLDISRSCMTT